MIIGLCVCGSFCTLKKTIEVAKRLKSSGHTLLPIFSYAISSMDTRFFKAEAFTKEIIAITGEEPITTIVDAEPIGPLKKLDLVLVTPTTGNTLAKIAAGITDTPVTMAVKAHLRNERPVVLSIATNDALSTNAQNIGALINRKHIYFVPFGQDDYINKPNSLVSDTSLTEKAIEQAMEGRQLQPLIL